MKFSVIIPVYNGGATLHRALNSVAGLADTEVLVIDDGSTDETPAILQDYSRKFEHIRIFSQENRGVSAARNLGLDNAQGDCILFLDADDFLAALPESWQKRADFGELFRTEQLCQLWNKVFRADVIRAGKLRFREALFVYEDLEFVMGYAKAAGELLLAPGLCHHRPSGLALARAGRLEGLEAVLQFLPAEFHPELATVLARQIIAAAPGKTFKILREYGKYCPKGRIFSLLRGALALRWRS